MKIAIVRLSALGDIIQTAVVIQFIKKHFNNAEIYWFCDRNFSQILSNIPEITRIIKLPLKEKKYFTTYKILRDFKNQFDYILDFQGLFKSAMVTKILGKNTFGFDENGVREPFASKFYNNKINCDYDKNVILRYSILTSKALGFDLSMEDIANKNKIFQSIKVNIQLGNEKTILISPFASEYNKCYPHFAKVIKELQDEVKIFVCHGNKLEKQLAEKIILGTKATLIPRLSINEMIWVVDNMSLVIGNDSAISHLAWAQNIPTVTIFGNRPSHRNTFITDINQVVDAGKIVDPRHINKGDYCIAHIPPQNIVDVARKLL